MIRTRCKDDNVCVCFHKRRNNRLEQRVGERVRIGELTRQPDFDGKRLLIIHSVDGKSDFSFFTRVEDFPSLEKCRLRSADSRPIRTRQASLSTGT